MLVRLSVYGLAIMSPLSNAEMMPSPICFPLFIFIFLLVLLFRHVDIFVVSSVHDFKKQNISLHHRLISIMTYFNNKKAHFQFSYLTIHNRENKGKGFINIWRTSKVILCGPFFVFAILCSLIDSFFILVFYTNNARPQTCSS